MKKIIVFIMIMIGFVFAINAFTEPKINGTAKDYEILERNLTTRYKEWNIYAPEAVDIKDRAATLFAALKDCIKEEHAEICQVNLEASKNAITFNKGNQYAYGFYTTNKYRKNKKCRIFASSTQLTEKELKITDLWFTHENKFLETNTGRLNEDKLIQYIADFMELPLDDIHLPYINYQEYMFELPH